MVNCGMHDVARPWNMATTWLLGGRNNGDWHQGVVVVHSGVTWVAEQDFFG